MKIVNDQSLINYLESLIETNYLNMSLSDMFSEVIGNREVTNKKEIEALKEKFGEDSTVLLANKCFEYWGLDDDNEDDEEIFKNRIAPSIKSSDINKYINNPYYKNINIFNVKQSDYSLVIDHYSPYELFAYKDMSVSPSYEENNSLSFFEKEFSFLAINHKDVTWMSVTPNEIETMEKAVNDAYGNVVVYGLGLGYFPYMISLKDDVKEITIIENDENIIELFKEHILPLFERKEKIKIIKDDAFKYMQESHSFNYSFVDLWHDPLDGIELFLKAKRLEKEGNKYFYWLESSFYILLRRCFISLLEEQLANTPESAYKKSKSFTDKIINTYYEKTKNLVLKDISQVQDLLTDSNLLNLII